VFLIARFWRGWREDGLLGIEEGRWGGNLGRDLWNEWKFAYIRYEFMVLKNICQRSPDTYDQHRYQLQRSQSSLPTQLNSTSQSPPPHSSDTKSSPAD
jgi:hypothetical protein